MAYEQKPNTGAIFKNDKKGNEKSPDYKGSINVDGKDLEIALWVKDSQKGEKFFSAKIQPKFEKSENKTVPAGKDDDLPF
jgi:uncharacterized protein (DUF736 family)